VGKTHRKARTSPEEKPRTFSLIAREAAYGISYHWLNRHGKYVRLSDVPDAGIFRILHILEENEEDVPVRWIYILRNIADERRLSEGGQ
jgi:hypothetical protein